MVTAFILQEDKNKEVFNTDYICLTIDSLITLIKKTFKEKNKDQWLKINEVLIGTHGTVIIKWTDISEKEKSFEEFTYIKIEIK